MDATLMLSVGSLVAILDIVLAILFFLGAIKNLFDEEFVAVIFALLTAVMKATS